MQEQVSILIKCADLVYIIRGPLESICRNYLLVAV